jgi:hypothetical protein
MFAPQLSHSVTQRVPPGADVFGLMRGVIAEIELSRTGLGMTDNNMQTHSCNHYPNRVLQKRDLAVELGGVCDRTVDNLLRAGKLPKPAWLNSIPVWMLYDVHAYLSAQAGKPRTGEVQTETAAKPTARRTNQNSKGTVHKAGKYSV